MNARNASVKTSCHPTKLKFECLQHIRIDQWSPEQISGVMRLKGEKISHTTIYTWVKEDRQAGGSLYEHLRHKGHRRKSNPYKSASARNIPNRTSIKDRPTEANGNRFGDWEMDLIIGKNGFQAILVLVERSTGYVIIHRLKHGKKARNWPKRSTGCFSHTGQRESLPLPRTMDLNFLNINSLQKALTVWWCILLILMLRGKKDW